MNSSIYRFCLDLHSTQSQISIPVLLGDTGRELHISLSDGGNPYIIADGCLAMLSVRRPSGTKFQEFCVIQNNTTIVYSFDQNENTAAVEGIHDCDITLYGARGGKIGTARFSMVVSERVIPSDGIVVTDEDQAAIDAMISAEAARQEAEAGRVNAEAQRQVNEGVRQDTLEQLEAALKRVDDKVVEIDGVLTDFNISTDLDETNYKLTVALTDTKGNVIASDTVDFPLESIEDMVDVKIAAAITTTLNTEVEG